MIQTITSLICRFASPRTLLALPIFLLGWGCDSFVEVEQPNSQLTASAVFDSKTTANAAMVNIYAQFRESGLLSGKNFGLSILAGCYTDELVSYETGAYSSEPFHNNALLASNPVITELWNASYNEIYGCNAVIEGVRNSANLEPADRSQLEGEALFMRSLIHFYLINLFGSVPYVTTTDYRQNQSIGKMSSEALYARLIEDLEQAVALLPEDYVSASRMRPNRAAAQALLAKVYLYDGQFAASANMASAVLNQSALYLWVDDLDAEFLKESTATIWQLSPAYEGYNTDEGLYFIIPFGPPYIAALSDTMVNAFADSDLRKTHWIGSVTDGTDTWYYPYKYKQPYESGATLECTIVMRLAEQYLIRAEARARQGEISGAREDLNKIRNRAGLADTDAFDGPSLLQAILEERRLEFFAEQGQRFFDLKRSGQIDAALAVKPGWNNTDRLWPLPQSELAVNPNLFPQNPGY